MKKFIYKYHLLLIPIIILIFLIIKFKIYEYNIYKQYNTINNTINYNFFFGMTGVNCRIIPNAEFILITSAFLSTLVTIGSGILIILSIILLIYLISLLIKKYYNYLDNIINKKKYKNINFYKEKKL